MQIKEMNSSELGIMATLNTSHFADNDTQEMYPDAVTALILWKHFPPFLIIIGTVGNGMTIFVLCRKTMWKMASSPHLVVLSVTDIIVLYSGLLRQWLNYLVNWDVREVSPTVCKLHTFIVYTSVDFSAWTLVAVSIERFISVCFPFKAKAVCTRRRTQVTLVIVLIVLFCLNSHFIYGFGAVYTNSSGTLTLISNCAVLYDHYLPFFENAWPWIDLSVFSLIPFCIIMACNISLITKIFRSRMKNKVLPSDAPSSQRVKPSSMTALMVSLNTLFLVTTSPISIYLIGFPEWAETATEEEYARLTLWWAVVNVLMYLNNSVNFFFYCVSGPRFRRELKVIFGRQNSVGPVPSYTQSQIQPAVTQPTGQLPISMTMKSAPRHTLSVTPM